MDKLTGRPKNDFGIQIGGRDEPFTASATDMLPGRRAEKIDYIAIDEAKVRNAPRGPRDGSLPWETASLEQAASALGLSVDDTLALLESGRLRLARTRPGTPKFLRFVLRRDDVIAVLEGRR